MLKRYFIDGSCECGRMDDSYTTEDLNGEWVKFDDTYEDFLEYNKSYGRN